MTPPDAQLVRGPRPGPRSSVGPFRHRPYAVFWAGGLVSNMGSWLQTVAGSIYVYQLTGSALAVGVLNFAGFLPNFLFSIVGGIVSDRYDRRRIVMSTHIVSVILGVGLAMVTFAGLVTEVYLIVAFFALNTMGAVAKPSIIAILPGLVPRDEVTEAVGLNSLQFVLGQISGPLIAALVMATAGAGWAFTVNALSYLGPIVSMAYLRRRGLGAHAERDRTPGGEPVGRANAATFVREQPWVLALLASIVTASAPVEIVRTLAPAVVVEGLGQPVTAAGLVVSAQSVGMAIALVAFVPMRRRGWSRAMVTLGLICQAVGLTGTALAPTLPVALVGAAFVGFGFSMTFSILTGTLQLAIPDTVRGRVMALHQMAHLGNRPVTALLIGGLATIVGAQPAVIVGAVLAPVGLLATRRAWRMLGNRAVESGSPSTDPLAEVLPG